MTDHLVMHFPGDPLHHGRVAPCAVHLGRHRVGGIKPVAAQEGVERLHLLGPDPGPLQLEEKSELLLLDHGFNLLAEGEQLFPHPVAKMGQHLLNLQSFGE